MDLNEFPEKLKAEEQNALNDVISRMDKAIQYLDFEMQEYVREAHNADTVNNPDEYLTLLLAKQKKANTVENRKKIIEGRDELYKTRLFLHAEDEEGSDDMEIKVGLHSCNYDCDFFVYSWKEPVCRHYFMDNSSAEYESYVDGYYTKWKLLVKDQVNLRFTRVRDAVNLFPGIVDDKALKQLRGKGFFTDAFIDEMIAQFNPEGYNPEEASKIISDRFLKELLERRATPEFKNIVFSIQKKQGEIISADYKKNMVVQGCAGSGKSMIMLHRIPIILFDNQKDLSRSSVYIVTPSEMYIQMADNMRKQLEISDIQMGTIEQYYNNCIEKYPGHSIKEYGRINYGRKIKSEDEKYIYSSECVDDIKNYYAAICDKMSVSLDKAYKLYSITTPLPRENLSVLQAINHRLSELQKVFDTNQNSIKGFFDVLIELKPVLFNLSDAIKNYKDNTISAIDRQIAKLENPSKQDKKSGIDAIASIDKLKEDKTIIEKDEEYFAFFSSLNEKFGSLEEIFSPLTPVFSKNEPKTIYRIIDNIGRFIGFYYNLKWELSRVQSKYVEYNNDVSKEFTDFGVYIQLLQETNVNYLPFEYLQSIIKEKNYLLESSANAVNNAYRFILNKIGIKGEANAIKCSPYLYLQALYQFSGVPSSGKSESLIAIDEAQGIAKEEMRLIDSINNHKTVFNVFGDIYQHIEGTKGIDDWEEFNDILNYDIYKMEENYRNASQITEYCNRVFGMSMNAINTPGKGVHELHSENEFIDVITEQLINPNRVGLSAILVGNDLEAKYLFDKFSGYEQKIHDMTGEDFNIHLTRWNIININDAKGLEFNSVIVLSGNMTRNQQYIAFTRALDDLYVYPENIDLSKYEEKKQKDSTVKDDIEKADTTVNEDAEDTNVDSKIKTIHTENSAVKKFFISKGLKVIDNREEGGRLWVIGEKSEIRSFINEAVVKFSITGKYMSCSESHNENGWCTKTDK